MVCVKVGKLRLSSQCCPRSPGRAIVPGCHFLVGGVRDWIKTCRDECTSVCVLVGVYPSVFGPPHRPSAPSHGSRPPGTGNVDE